MTIALALLVAAIYTAAILTLAAVSGFNDAPPTHAERTTRRRHSSPVRIAIARARLAIARRDYRWTSATHPRDSELLRHKEAAVIAAHARLQTLRDQRTADDIALQATRTAKQALLKA